MDPAEKKQMVTQWIRNETELHRLADVPAGQTDPAQREAEIEFDQDEIEYELGRDYLHRKKSDQDGAETGCESP